MATGCYVRRYLPASYKGIPFEVMDARSDHGRRGALAEFPFRDTPGYIDLGRKAREFQISAVFRTNDHVARAHILRRACESPQPGVLVHPTFGIVLSAACRKCSIADRMENEAGITYVDLELVEAPAESGAILVRTVASSILSGISGAITGHLARALAPGALGPIWHNLVVNFAGNVVGTIFNQVNLSALAGMDTFINRALSVLQPAMQNVRTLLDPVIATDTLITGTLGVGRRAGANVSIGAFRDLANDLALLRPPGFGAAQASEALLSAGRAAVAGRMAAIAINEWNASEPETRQAANTIDAILAQEERHAQNVGDSAYFLRIREVRLSVASALAERAASAPHIVSMNTSGSVPPLVAAYLHLGDARRVREIQALNCVSSDGRVARNPAVPV